MTKPKVIARIRAVAFWFEFTKTYPHQQVDDWMDSVAQNRGDWYRNISLTRVAISEQCRIGRIGFDEAKFEDGKKFVDALLEKYNLTGLMQW